ISLAHRGVLFLDELPEFQRQVLEVLREPLESGSISISRARAQLEFPARFQLVAAMNPCPCGYLGAGDDRCHCTPDQILRYRRKISGPLLDRFDLHVPVNAVDSRQLQTTAPAGDSSAQTRARVIASRERQLQRQGKSNGRLESKELEAICPLKSEQRLLLERAMD